MSDDTCIEILSKLYVCSVLGLARFRNLGEELDDFLRVLRTRITIDNTERRTSYTRSTFSRSRSLLDRSI